MLALQITIAGGSNRAPGCESERRQRNDEHERNPIAAEP